MSNYVIYGSGKSIFASLSGAGTGQDLTIAEMLMYVTPTEFGILNPDGSRTYFKGEGFVWDPVDKSFSAGVIISVEHYSVSYDDEITNTYLDVRNLNYQKGSVVAGIIEPILFAGDDTLDARNRVGGLIAPVTLNGFDGTDTIYGGRGSDWLSGGEGSDLIVGGGGNDRFFGDAGSDRLAGGSGADRFVGGYDNDVISGGSGNDVIFGGFGNDRMNGGTGTDTAVFAAAFSTLKIEKTTSGFKVTSSDGVDILASNVERIATDTGVHQIDANGTWAKIASTAGVSLALPENTFAGTDQDNVMAFGNIAEGVVFRALAGNDRAYGGSGSDLLIGGAGNDYLVGSQAPQDEGDRLYGNDGIDILIGKAGKDYMSGGNGNDFLFGQDSVLVEYDIIGLQQPDHDAMYGGAGDDVMFGSIGNDLINGGSGTDTAVYAVNFADLTITKTSTGFEVLYSDSTDALTSIERIATSDGTYSFNTTLKQWTFLNATTAAQVVAPGLVLPPLAYNGTDGDDTIRIPGGVTVVNGLGGNDQIFALDTRSYEVHGGSGNDTIRFYTGTAYGDDGNDDLSITSGIGTVYGGNGDDILRGKTLDGGAGADLLYGNVSNAIMTGGADNDTFDFTYSLFRNPQTGQVTSSIPWGNNVITDFAVGIDKLSIHNVLNGATGYDFTETLTLTSDGWLVQLKVNGIPEARSSILLQGVTTPGLTIDDLVA